MNDEISRELLLTHDLNKVKMMLIHEEAYIYVKKLIITSHLSSPEAEWRRLIEKLTLKFSLRGYKAPNLNIPISFKTMASSLSSTPTFDVDINLPKKVASLSKYSGGNWEEIEVSIEANAPAQYEVKLVFESDMIPA